MPDTLATIARFSDPMLAALARNYLHAAGISAFLVDESFASVAWHLITAVGGVRLQVATADIERAHTILLPQSDAFGYEDEPGDGPNFEEEEEDPSDESAEPTHLDQTANRAFRAAAFGMLFSGYGLLCLMLQFYAFWLLLKVLTSEEPLSRRSFNRVLWTAMMCLPFVILILLFAASVIIGKPTLRVEMPWNYLRSY